MKNIIIEVSQIKFCSLCKIDCKAYQIPSRIWQDCTSHEAASHKSFHSLETIRNSHLGTSPHPERIDPDTLTDEFYFLDQPGQADIQTDFF